MSDEHQGSSDQPTDPEAGYPVSPPLAPIDPGLRPSPTAGLPAPPPPPPPPTAPSPGGRQSLALIVALSLIAVVSLVVAVVTVLADGNDDGGGEEATETGDARSTTTDTTEREAPTTTEPDDDPDSTGPDEPDDTTGGVEPPGFDEEEAPPTNGGDVEVTDQQGFQQYETEYEDTPLVTYGVILENTADRVARYLELQISFLDAEGTVVGTDETYLTVIPPGETFGVGGDFVEVRGEATEMQVTVAVERWVAADNYGSITVSDIEAVEDEYETGVVFNAESTYPYNLDLTEVHAILYDSEGAIVGGANDLGLFLRPGASSSGSVSLLDPIPNVDLSATQVYIDPGLM